MKIINNVVLDDYDIELIDKYIKLLTISYNKDINILNNIIDNKDIKNRIIMYKDILHLLKLLKHYINKIN